MCYNKKTKNEIIFILLLYKIFPFIHISKKIDFLDKLEIMIDKSENKKVFLKLNNYFKKNWFNQKLLLYNNNYYNNQFYDITNNISEAFNHSINHIINGVHPQITIYINRKTSIYNKKESKRLFNF